MKKIIINQHPWQTRIAITLDEKLQNIYFSSPHDKNLERIFFKGIITKILPGIQTAFVDIGQEKAGFLHISEIDREMAIAKLSKDAQLDDEGPIVMQNRQSMDISKILKEGDPILVQVSKEPVYDKGAKLTTCFTLPGRFVVLMPNIARIGVSKKIEDRDERIRLKEIVSKALPEGMGVIIRTTSEHRQAKEILKDIDFLVDTWKEIQHKFARAQPHESIYEDIELPLQIIRDHLDDDVEAIIIDNKDLQRDVYKFVKLIAPEYGHKIHWYDQATPIFEYYNIDKQIEAALEHKVPLKSGGSLIIETTQAMTVVDVNTGSFTGKRSLEDTILKTNLEAAQEVVRQLRLRNIGGLIVIDFIDMASASNQQKLFKSFEKNLRDHDKFQSVVLKVSEFGLVQMTRKRSGKTLIQQLTDTCTTCKGMGFVKSIQMQTYAILRTVKEELGKVSPGSALTLSLHPQIFSYITSHEYNTILLLEKMYKITITLVSQKHLDLTDHNLEQAKN